VIRAGEPEGVVAAHPLPPGQDVLQGHEDRVTHVQGAGDVRGRDDDGERRLLGNVLRGEISPFPPEGIPVGLHFGGFVGLGKRFSLGCHVGGLRGGERQGQAPFFPPSLASRSTCSRMIVSASWGTTSQAILSIASREALERASRSAASPPAAGAEASGPGVGSADEVKSGPLSGASSSRGISSSTSEK